MALGGEPTLADWTPSVLTKYIRDLFLNSPPDFLPELKAESVQVYTSLGIRDKVDIFKDREFRKIGGQGNPSFTNSWVNYGSNWADAAFWKDPFGTIHLRGRIKSGTVGNPAFTLPPGFRPFTNQSYAVLSNATIGGVTVLTDGTVNPISPSNNTYVSLDGIYFRTT